MHPQISWTITQKMICTPDSCTNEKNKKRQNKRKSYTQRHRHATKLEHAGFSAHTNTVSHSLRWFMTVRLRFAWFILLKLHCAPEGLNPPLHTMHGGLLTAKQQRNVRLCACLHIFVFVHTSSVICFYCVGVHTALITLAKECLESII